MYSEVEKQSKTFLPVNRNGWWIKFSTYCGHNVLLVFTSMFTGQTIVRYFDNEDKAVNYINYIIETDPSIPIEQDLPD